MSTFVRTVGIDYSGAATPTSSLKGVRVYLAEDDAVPVEVSPPPSSRKYWTRRGVAEWLVNQLSENAPTLVGIDHGFSFPRRYFEAHGLELDWPLFLDDFHRHWPTDKDNTYVEFVRDGSVGNGAARMGSARWRRLTEERAGRAKSVFHFDVQGSVAKSTHAGIPGCDLSGSSSAAECISGRSMAGRFRPDDRLSPRSILPCGRTDSGATAALATSTTPFVLRPGSRVPTATAVLRRCSTPISHRWNGRLREWKVGFWVSQVPSRGRATGGRRRCRR